MRSKIKPRVCSLRICTKRNATQNVPAQCIWSSFTRYNYHYCNGLLLMWGMLQSCFVTCSLMEMMLLFLLLPSPVMWWIMLVSLLPLDILSGYCDVTYASDNFAFGTFSWWCNGLLLLLACFWHLFLVMWQSLVILADTFFRVLLWCNGCKWCYCFWYLILVMSIFGFAPGTFSWWCDGSFCWWCQFLVMWWTLCFWYHFPGTVVMEGMIVMLPLLLISFPR